MVAALNDLPVLQHHDRIGVADCRKPVGDDKGRPIAISRCMPCSMCFSVRVSTELVASSRIRIGALETAARAMFNSWRCPWLKFAPSPSSIVSYPSGRRMIKECADAVFAALNNFFIRGIQPPVSNIFPYRAGKRCVSCRTIAIFSRSSFRCIRRTSTPSTVIEPPCIS